MAAFRCPTCNRYLGKARYEAHVPACKGPKELTKKAYADRRKRVKAAVKGSFALALALAWWFMFVGRGVGSAIGPFDSREQCEQVRAWRELSWGSVSWCWYARPAA